ncbi:MAG TPA: glycosyltransferase family 4 protein [Chitinispirillaceae bacterium]|jgi:glycosyltransferase involved in cell wall biosynthesis|nr:glycosyltransferase family 4 protein [Chitinispirillaceae bacterium]
MQILYISNEYPPQTGFGGIGTYTKHTAEGMAARGHTVHVMSRSITGEYSRTLANEVIVHRIPLLDFNLPSGKVFFPFRKLCYKMILHSLERLAWAESVSKALQKFQENGCSFDIIEYPECGAEGFHIRGQKGLLVTRLHTPWQMISEFDQIKEAPGDPILLTLMEKHSARKAQLVTSPSCALAGIMKKRWKLRNITVIPNSLPADQYDKTSGGGWIYTGRVEMRKGVHILLDAYEELCKSRSSLPALKIIGRAYGTMKDGTSYGELIRKRINSAPLNGRVEWIEGLSLPDVKNHLLTSSVAIFPSLWENFPYTALEAMACGLTVVASDCGGYPEMIQHEKNGFLVKAGSGRDLSEGLKKILDNKEMAKDMGDAARKRVQSHFDTFSICESLERIYENALRDK